VHMTPLPDYGPPCQRCGGPAYGCSCPQLHLYPCPVCGGPPDNCFCPPRGATCTDCGELLTPARMEGYPNQCGDCAAARYVSGRGA
jgi:hypothetical protein